MFLTYEKGGPSNSPGVTPKLPKYSTKYYKFGLVEIIGCYYSRKSEQLADRWLKQKNDHSFLSILYGDG